MRGRGGFEVRLRRWFVTVHDLGTAAKEWLTRRSRYVGLNRAFSTRFQGPKGSTWVRAALKGHCR